MHFLDVFTKADAWQLRDWTIERENTTLVGMHTCIYLLYIHVLCIVHTCIMRVSAVSSVRIDWQPKVHQKAEFPWDTYYQVKGRAILLSFYECLMLLLFLIPTLHFFQICPNGETIFHLKSLQSYVCH